MVYKRYSSPLAFLQQMIDSEKFEDWVDKVLQLHNEETRDKMIWEMWLHKEFEGNPSYEELRARIIEPEKQEDIKVDLGATIKENFEMMENFHPV